MAVATVLPGYLIHRRDAFRDFVTTVGDSVICFDFFGIACLVSYEK